MQTIYERRSIKFFRDAPVPEDIILKIVHAGMQAPCANNQQVWEFMVVQNPARLKTLASFSDNAEALQTASAAVIVLLNREKLIEPEYFQQDLSACTQNMLLEAADYEIGSMWIGAYPDEKKIGFISSMFDLEDHLIPFSVVALGYPREITAIRFVNKFDSDKIHYDNPNI